MILKRGVATYDERALPPRRAPFSAADADPVALAPGGLAEGDLAVELGLQAEVVDDARDGERGGLAQGAGGEAGCYLVGFLRGALRVVLLVGHFGNPLRVKEGGEGWLMKVVGFLCWVIPSFVMCRRPSNAIHNVQGDDEETPEVHCHPPAQSAVVRHLVGPNLTQAWLGFRQLGSGFVGILPCSGRWLLRVGGACHELIERMIRTWL